MDDPQMKRADIVIVGTGHGGAQAAIALRQAGFEGSILMIGRDAEPPYERPPLTKEYLAGDKPFERMLIRPEAFWADKRVALRLSSAVTGVDPADKTLTLTNGTTVEYGTLIWSGGGDPRRLSCPGAELVGVHSVRDKHHVDALLADLGNAPKRVVVVGGGYIGLEAAAVLRGRGCAVTLLEVQDRVLSRVAGEDLSRFYEAQHREHGVTIMLEAEVESIAGVDGRVAGVQVAGGPMIPCDVVVAGIGIVPAVGPLITAGAAGANGVDVDEFCRTSLADIYAIGDCAAHANRYAGGAVIRLESVQNAHDMAKTVARAICGEAEPYGALPWFWSNQYDLKLQTAGLSMDHDTAVTRGDPDAKSFSVVYLRENRVIAVDAVNKTKDYVQGSKLIEARTEVSADEVRDAEVLKDLR